MRGATDCVVCPADAAIGVQARPARKSSADRTDASAGSPSWAEMSSAALQMLFGGIIVTIAGLAIGEAPRFALNARTLTAMIYLTIFGSVIAYSAYVFALAHLRTTVTALYAYVNPVVAVFLGWLILSEPLTAKSIMAMVVILAGVALVQTAGWKRKPAPVAAEAVKKAA